MVPKVGSGHCRRSLGTEFASLDDYKTYVRKILDIKSSYIAKLTIPINFCLIFEAPTTFHSACPN